MRHFIYLAAILVTIPSYTCAWWDNVVDTIETYYPNGQLEQRYVQITFGGNEETQMSGFYRSYHQNGQLRDEGQYWRGLETGTWIKWDSTGRRIMEISYLDGQKHGREIEWNPSGTLKSLLHYRYGQFHGLCTWYSSDYIINDFINHPCHPIVMQHIYVDGKQLVRCKNKDDKPCVGGLPCDGNGSYYSSKYDLWIEWSVYPDEFYVGRKIDGKKDGRWILWSAEGEKKQVDFYSNGQLLEL